MGSYVNYTYDKIGQLNTALGLESGGTTNRLLEQLGYAYDAAGNLHYRTNNALVQTFTVTSINGHPSASGQRYFDGGRHDGWTGHQRDGQRVRRIPL